MTNRQKAVQLHNVYTSAEIGTLSLVDLFEEFLDKETLPLLRQIEELEEDCDNLRGDNIKAKNAEDLEHRLSMTEAELNAVNKPLHDYCKKYDVGTIGHRFSDCVVRDAEALRLVSGITDDGPYLMRDLRPPGPQNPGELARLEEEKVVRLATAVVRAVLMQGE